MAALGPHLSRCRVLASLSVHANALGSVGTCVLAPSLSRCEQLTALDVGSNRVRAVGATAIAAALKRTPALAALNMSLNAVEDSGAAVLTKVLGSSCPNLTMLNLHGNDLGEPAAASVAAMLPRVPKLISLVLSSNPDIGPNGVVQLAPAVCKAPQLRLLSLDGVRAGDDGIAALADELPEAPALTCLHVGFCGLSMLGVEVRNALRLSF